MRRLDDFLAQYTTSFRTLKENIDKIFQLSKRNYYYSNTNTLQQKLLSLSTGEAQRFILSNTPHISNATRFLVIPLKALKTCLN